MASFGFRKIHLNTLFLLPYPSNDYSFSKKATALFDYIPFPSVPKEASLPHKSSPFTPQ